jgi:LEA14-like dessication related protein
MQRTVKAIPKLSAAIVLLALACGSMFQAPSVKVRGIDVVATDELNVRVVFRNPNRFAIDIAEMEYRISIESMVCGTGQRESMLHLGGRDSTTAEFPLHIDYDNLARSLPYLLRDSVRFGIAGTYKLPKILGKRTMDFKTGKKLALKAQIDSLLPRFFR